LDGVAQDCDYGVTRSGDRDIVEVLKDLISHNFTSVAHQRSGVFFYCQRCFSGKAGWIAWRAGLSKPFTNILWFLLKSVVQIDGAWPFRVGVV